MKSYKVIYELIDEVRGLMEGRLSTVEERAPLGEAEVRAVFGTGSRRVAGCMVTEGLLRKGCLVSVSIQILYHAPALGLSFQLRSCQECYTTSELELAVNFNVVMTLLLSSQ